jgi:hypothetical protein
MEAATRDSGLGSAAAAAPPVKPTALPSELTELPTKLTLLNRVAKASLAITRQSNRSIRATAAMAARLPVATEKSRITTPASVSSTTLFRKMLM